MISLLFLSVILGVILSFYDEDFVVHYGWYIVTILVVIFITTGCTSIPTTPYDNDPFIFYE